MPLLSKRSKWNKKQRGQFSPIAIVAIDWSVGAGSAAASINCTNIIITTINRVVDANITITDYSQGEVVQVLFEVKNCIRED